MRQEEDFRERGALLNDRKRPRGRRGADGRRCSFVLPAGWKNQNTHSIQVGLYWYPDEADSGHVRKGRSMGTRGREIIGGNVDELLKMLDESVRQRVACLLSVLAWRQADSRAR